MSEQPYKNIPDTGTVEKVRLKWRVKEDGALAHSLQTQEFDDHFCGNRQRNGYAYKDYSLARNEQLMEQKIFQQKCSSDRCLLFQQEKVADELASGGTKHVKIQCVPEELEQEISRDWSERELEVGLPQMFITDNKYFPQFNDTTFQNIQDDFPKAKTSTMRILHEKTTQTDDEPLIANNINVSYYDVDVYDVHQGLPVVDKPCKPVSEQKEEDEDAELAVRLQIQEVIEHDRLYHHPKCAPVNKPNKEVSQQEEEDAELAIRLQIQEVSSQEALERDRLLALKTQNDELADLL